MCREDRHRGLCCALGTRTDADAGADPNDEHNMIPGEQQLDVDAESVRIDYLKVDCEGCEYEFLPGIADWVTGGAVGITVCEVHRDALAGYGFLERWRLLRSVHGELCRTNPWGAITDLAAGGSWLERAVERVVGTMLR